jgi:hypothetical protein
MANGEVTMTTARPQLKVTAKLGKGLAQITDGYGTWELVQRPRRQSLTQWTGRPPFSMQVPLLIDGWGKDREVVRTDPSQIQAHGRFTLKDRGIEIDISDLERMSQPPTSGEQPPIVHVTGDVPKSDPNLDWVISAIEWGDAIRGAQGRRVRQEVTVTFLRYIEPDYVVPGKARVLAASQADVGLITLADTSTVSAGRVVYAQQGDSLADIAVREYGDATKWVALADLNNIRDPKAIVEGQRLRLP